MKNVRPNEVSINDYVVVEFESLHQIAKSHETEVLVGAVVYRLLNNSNLPERKNSLLRLLSTIWNEDDDIMKEQLKKVLMSHSFERYSVKEKSEELQQNDYFLC